MYALFELDEHYNMPLYEVANPDLRTLLRNISLLVLIILCWMIS